MVRGTAKDLRLVADRARDGRARTPRGTRGLSERQTPDERLGVRRGARACAQLERQFGRDAQLAERLAGAQDRLMRANDRLWWVFTPTASPPSTASTPPQ